MLMLAAECVPPCSSHPLVLIHTCELELGA